jgi:hypothetical protein
MIGITIGVGDLYKKVAETSAEFLKQHTGLNSIIIDSEQFMESKLSHPAALKLKLFDFTNEENILYFDADWFLVNNWDPTIFQNNKNIIACHDFVLNRDYPDQNPDFYSIEFNGIDGRNHITCLNGEPRVNYINDIAKFTGLNMHYSKWINTGMFIVNRTNHLKWLKLSEENYTSEIGHHEKYFEQPSMMKAMEKLMLTVDFLPRKYNVLLFRKTKFPNNVIGLHIKISKTNEFEKLINYINDGILTSFIFNKMFIKQEQLFM